MALPATLTQFKAQFVREFQYGISADLVMDADITRALNEANVVFNTGLWADSGEAQIAFLYAAAHFMVLNLQVAGGLSSENLSQGANSRGRGPVLSKTVGPVSLTFQLAESFTNEPTLAGFMTTDFGQRYLAMLAPRLVGAAFVMNGPSESDLTQ